MSFVCLSACFIAKEKKIPTPLWWKILAGSFWCHFMISNSISEVTYILLLFFFLDNTIVFDNRYSTTVETLPSVPPYLTNDGIHPQTQEMRILIGRPLKHPPKFPVVNHSLRFNSIAEHTSSDPDYEMGSLFEDRNICSDGLNNFVLYCTSDFFTVSKEVHVRTRRVRLLGLEVSYFAC